jgi:hypothetical protein
LSFTKTYPPRELVINTIDVYCFTVSIEVLTIYTPKNIQDDVLELREGGGVSPLSISLTELVTLLKESPDSLRTHGALPKSFRRSLSLLVSSFDHAPVFVIWCMLE